MLRFIALVAGLCSIAAATNLTTSLTAHVVLTFLALVLILGLAFPRE